MPALDNCSGVKITSLKGQKRILKAGTLNARHQICNFEYKRRCRREAPDADGSGAIILSQNQFSKAGTYIAMLQICYFDPGTVIKGRHF